MELITGILLLISLALVFADIVWRGLIGVSLEWVNEVCRFILIWLVFYGASVVTRKAVHLTIGVSLGSKLTGKKLIVLKLFTNSCILCVLITVLIYGSILLYSARTMTAPSIGVPMYVVWSAIPINAALMSFYIVKDTIYLFRRREVK